MKLLRNLLVVTATTGAMSAVQAQVPGNTFDLGLLTPSIVTTADAFASGSFMDTFNFTVGADHRLVTATTESTNVSNLQLALYDSGGTLLYTGTSLNATLTPGDFSARVSGDVVSTPGSFTFSVAATPEPAEWMLLAFGLLLAGFVARRKIGFAATPPACGA
jgi:hypothetical protein